MKLLFSILFLLNSLAVLAQDSPYSVPIDSTNKNKQYIPTGIRLGVDILGPILNQFDKRVLSYEMSAEVDLSNYSVIFETGHEDFAEKNDNIDYGVSGNFSRIGPEVNFLSADKNLNTLTFGLRYSWSKFTERAAGNITEINWGAVPVDFTKVENVSNWLEMTTGVKVRI